ncbi:glycosyltransferase family 4 protein [Mycolicibacterium mengxianglii]|uniref:glycosyltransferase family 4 protein n=1 Tax=Mycolicibacterium mengxianglii TaxID=2736649 RepID=UPI0018D0C96B|nr:glycosyltransferase family 4 protein [Mycolicibacterium mengxianglii]
MRFAFLTELYHPNLGGQEVFFQELAEAMVRRGHSVDVYCIGHHTSLAVDETLNGVRIRRNPLSNHYLNPPIPALRRNWSDVLRFSAGVRQHVVPRRYDFHLVNQWPLLHVAALPRKLRARTGIHWCEVREDPVLGQAQRRLPRMVGSNFAVSKAVAAAITEQSGQPCSVLPSGIELTRYRVAERSRRSGALYVGRLAPHKNLPLLIDAFELAAARGFDGDLVIAGDGPTRADIEDHAGRSSLTSRVHVLGSVTEAQKIQLLSQAAVLGMPSQREGFPRVIAEAMASGLPVVTAGFPENGAKDVVSQYGSGVVCGTGPADFAEALLTAQAQWDTFSTAGLAGAQSLDWSGIAQALETRALEVCGRYPVA